MRLLDAGDGGVLAEFDDLDTVLAHYRALDANRPAGVVDLVPAARTILVRFDPGHTDRASIARWLRETDPETGTATETGALVRIPVRYDGPDLATVGELTGLGPDGVVAAHTGSDWTVAFAGFAPGFGYLIGGDPRLRVPRRDDPRTEVPAGAVGLAGEFSGVYPRKSPGGWQLIGHTTELMWDADREPPALLRPGDTVRFVAV
ncbi:5-oxoprolinase subunit B family protein [Rhodococcus maanshanensis]|uniref:Sensor histidine kinase inhibitor, KipI family n=1 Tax=Rhodococcus maanshanensis TaxID=183556 RepID=A0A1H7H9P1_9NOCA|nr:allophanate hydrolase subunit 1 [Rhodococcus maanshanensis]SEK44815.1 sensor histidine kinase inhibitor, KipI family [Rhodococcus maanshanensis]